MAGARVGEDVAEGGEEFGGEGKRRMDASGGRGAGGGCHCDMYESWSEQVAFCHLHTAMISCDCYKIWLDNTAQGKPDGYPRRVGYSSDEPEVLQLLRA